MLNTADELQAIMAPLGRGLDDSSAEFVIALREAGVVGDADWQKVKEWLREAMQFLSGPERTVLRQPDGTVVIDPNADPRNANWLRLDSAQQRAGFRLPGWVSLVALVAPSGWPAGVVGSRGLRGKPSWYGTVRSGMTSR